MLECILAKLPVPAHAGGLKKMIPERGPQTVCFLEFIRMGRRKVGVRECSKGGVADLLTAGQLGGKDVATRFL